MFIENDHPVYGGVPRIRELWPHVDYNHWGLAVQTAKRFDTPVIHVQSTGSLKAYAMFPSNGRNAPTFRAELTEQIAEYFEKRVVPHRARIHRSASSPGDRRVIWGAPRGGAAAAPRHWS